MCFVDLIANPREDVQTRIYFNAALNHLRILADKPDTQIGNFDNAYWTAFVHISVLISKKFLSKTTFHLHQIGESLYVARTGAVSQTIQYAGLR
jgi:hypothetical protein